MKRTTFSILALILTFSVFSQIPRKIIYPSERIEYNGITNPLFVTDIVNADLNIGASISNILGISLDTGFAVIYTNDATNLSYISGGYIVKNGSIYSFPARPSASYSYIDFDTIDILPRTHGTSTQKATYRNRKMKWSTTATTLTPLSFSPSNYPLLNIKSIYDKTDVPKSEYAELSNIYLSNLKLIIGRDNKFIYLTGDYAVSEGFKNTGEQILTTSLSPVLSHFTTKHYFDFEINGLKKKCYIDNNGVIRYGDTLTVTGISFYGHRNITFNAIMAY